MGFEKMCIEGEKAFDFRSTDLGPLFLLLVLPWL